MSVYLFIKYYTIYTWAFQFTHGKSGLSGWLSFSAHMFPESSFCPEHDSSCFTSPCVAVYKLCCILELNHILPTFRGVPRNVTSHCMSVCACIHSNVGQGGIYSHVCGCIHAWGTTMLYYTSLYIWHVSFIYIVLDFIKTYTCPCI